MDARSPAAGPVRVLLVYESMFGNTEAVAEAVAEGMRGAGMTVDVTDVTRAGPLSDLDHDLLVVGAPTHAFSLSRPATRQDAVRQGGRPGAAGSGLREWLTATPAPPTGDGRPAAAFDTRVNRVRRLPAAAANRSFRLLRHLGFTMLSRPTGFLVTDTAGDLLPGELERGRAWGRMLADETRSALSAR